MDLTKKEFEDQQAEQYERGYNFGHKEGFEKGYKQKTKTILSKIPHKSTCPAHHINKGTICDCPSKPYVEIIKKV